jgi:hypothetical protein
MDPWTAHGCHIGLHAASWVLASIILRIVIPVFCRVGRYYRAPRVEKQHRALSSGRIVSFRRQYPKPRDLETRSRAIAINTR